MKRRKTTGQRGVKKIRLAASAAWPQGKPESGAAKLGAQPRPCACGCGEATGGGWFRPGHDARLKGLLLRVERGEPKEKLLPAVVVERHKWVKRGAGEAPTTDYAGRPHQGYDR